MLFRRRHRIRRAFRRLDTAIIFAANDAFAPYLSVMLRSIVDHSSTSEYYDIFLLGRNVSEERLSDISSLFDGFPNFSFRCIDVVEELEKKRLFTENNPGISIDAYSRLLIPRLFTAYSRAVYLDGDMLVQTDVAELYNIPFDGKQLISTRDLWGTCFCYAHDEELREYRSNLLRSNSVDDYFITGFIIFNLDVLTPDASNDLLELAASREWRHHDQDVLNAYFVGKTKLIHAAWDYLYDRYDMIRYLPDALRTEYREAEDNPKIIHFGGNRKPWKQAYQRDDLLFWETAYKTPFFEEIFSNVRKLEYKLYILRHLGLRVDDCEYMKDDIVFRYQGQYLGRFSTQRLYFDFLSICEGYLEAECWVARMGLSDEDCLSLVACIEDKAFYLERLNRNKIGYRSKGDAKWVATRFRFSIDLSQIECRSTLSFYALINETPVYLKALSFAKFCAIGGVYRNSYQYASGYMLSTDSQSLYVEPATKEQADLRERSLLCELSSREDYEEIAELRLVARNSTIDKPIWVFLDRTNKADDNAEAFYRYMLENHRDEVDCYFVIREDSPDYERMKTYGTVVAYQSKRHKLLHLLASYILSSQSDMIEGTPFGSSREAYRDLLQEARSVFLQHGIIHADVSRWCNRTNLNPWLFVTTAKMEYDNILANERYDFDSSILTLSGLPRFDRLSDRREKLIVIMPTWRKHLVHRREEDNGVWKVNDDFSETRYFKFWNSVITDARLIACARRTGYRIAFLPHPNIQTGLHLFSQSNGIGFLDATTSYSDVFSRLSLMVTDYSSCFFDSAYLRKPVVYACFDEGDFFSGEHTSSEGFFDCERDGFGEVVRTEEELISLLISYMQTDCSLKPKYRERIDRFFAYSDAMNSERLYEAMRKKAAMALCVHPLERVQTLDFLARQSPSTLHIPVSALSKGNIAKACSKIGLPTEKAYTKKCAQGDALVWATEIETPIDLTLPVEMRVVAQAGMHLPRFKNCAITDARSLFIAHLGALSSGSTPFTGESMFKGEKIDSCELGSGWHSVKIVEGALSLAPGDILRFGESIVMVFSVSNEERRAVFIIPYCDKRDMLTVRVGSLDGLTRSSNMDDLPTPWWQLRKV